MTRFPSRLRAGPVTMIALASALLAAGCVAPPEPDLEGAASGSMAAGFSGTHVFPGKYNLTVESFSRTLVEGAFAILEPEVVAFESALDGARIEIGVVRPDVPDFVKVPVIVYASPYFFPLETIDLKARAARHVENFVPHGYAVALVPVRGSANMGGCMDLMGNAERADLSQALTWLAEQEWSNGAIGMIGVSYDGSTPWEMAAEGHPALKTIVPISGVNDVYHLMFRNGTNEFRGPLVLNALYYQYGFIENNPTNGRSAENTARGVVCPESLKGLYASMHAGFTGERDPLGFWAERNSRPGVESNYDGSILLVHGLQDWNVDPAHAYPWVNALEEKGLVVKHMLGQWGHAAPDSRPQGSEHARLDWAQILLNWFDYWLKGDATADLGPRAQVADSTGRWRSEPDGWPPKDSEPWTFFLQPGGKLAREPDVATESELLVPDPREASLIGPKACELCVAFESEPFERETRFAGLPKVPLRVTPTGPVGHVAAQLYVSDAGGLTRVGWGQIDLRFAEGGENMRPVVPGQTITARLELEPLDVVIPAGASLVLKVGQGTYGDHIPSLPTMPVRLEVGGEGSSLTIDVFERSESAFFVPPKAVQE